MYNDVKIKIKKKNKILFNHQSECLQSLINLMQNQTHQTLILWALDNAQEALHILQAQYPDDHRPLLALEKAYDWAQGKIKMSEAKRAILDCHAITKEVTDVQIQALCHAIGQAASTVHVGTHALGFVFYELTAIVLSHINWEDKVSSRIQDYIESLKKWQNHSLEVPITWATFLKK